MLLAITILGTALVVALIAVAESRSINKLLQKKLVEVTALYDLSLLRVSATERAWSTALAAKDESQRNLSELEETYLQSGKRNVELSDENSRLQSKLTEAQNKLDASEAALKVAMAKSSTARLPRKDRKRK